MNRLQKLLSLAKLVTLDKDILTRGDPNSFDQTPSDDPDNVESLEELEAEESAEDSSSDDDGGEEEDEGITAAVKYQNTKLAMEEFEDNLNKLFSSKRYHL